MFRYLKSFILASFIGGLSSTAALAQNPFAPSLSLNDDPEICSAFRGAWVDVYNGAKKIEDSAVDLKAAFPDANHISPTEDDVNAGYSKRSKVAFDFDEDGDEEILYFESKDPKWIYWATGLYLYNSQEAFESENVKDGQFGRFNNWVVGREVFENPKDSKAKLLAMYKDLKVAQLFQIDGKLYSQSEVKGARRRPYRQYGTGNSPRTVTLDWLRPDHKPTPICEIDFTRKSIEDKVAVSNFEAIVQPEMPILRPLLDMSGGRLKTSCYGSLGHSAVPISTHLQALYYRPQTMGYVTQNGEKIFQNPAADAAREFRFITWGLSDPSSFEVIRELKSHYPQFVTDFTTYYQTYFGMDEAVAKNMAEQGYRYLLDKVVYGQIHDRQSIYRRNYYRRRYNGRAQGVYNSPKIGPETSLKEIANALIDKVVAEEYGTPDYALRLGMMTGVEAERLIPLADEVMEYVEAQELEASISLSKKSTKQRTINQLFLASSTHPEMLQYFLDLGADVDFPTNYFQKTALMYAAQNNNLEAVVNLLKNGANPNSKTEFKPEPRQFCLPPLKRDARTPLMYAAENADATLILTMLEAGADLTAKDTQDNDVLWYLEQNRVVSDGQKVNLQIRLAAQ